MKITEVNKNLLPRMETLALALADNFTERRAIETSDIDAVSAQGYSVVPFELNIGSGFMNERRLKYKNHYLYQGTQTKIQILNMREWLGRSNFNEISDKFENVEEQLGLIKQDYINPETGLIEPGYAFSMEDGSTRYKHYMNGEVYNPHDMVGEYTISKDGKITNAWKYSPDGKTDTKLNSYELSCFATAYALKHNKEDISKKLEAIEVKPMSKVRHNPT